MRSSIASAGICMRVPMVCSVTKLRNALPGELCHEQIDDERSGHVHRRRAEWKCLPVAQSGEPQDPNRCSASDCTPGADHKITEHNKAPAAHSCAKQESLALNRSGGFPELREGKLHCRWENSDRTAFVKLCADGCSAPHHGRQAAERKTAPSIPIMCRL